MIKTKEDLKKFRLKLGKTQEQFANDLGVSLSYYGKVEGGRLAFYEGIKKSANDFEARLKAYNKATNQYIEVQKETAAKKPTLNLYLVACIFFFSLIGSLWILKN